MKKLIYFLFIFSLPLQAAEIIGVGIPPIAFLVERVGGEKIEVVQALKDGQNPHTFSLSPKTITMLSKAKAYFSIDFPFEEKITSTLNQIDGIKIVDISKGIRRITSENDHDEHHDNHHNEHHHGEFDPHIWTSPRNLSVMTGKILETLSKLFPQHSSSFTANAKDLLKEIEYLQSKIERNLKPLHEKSILIYHPSINYLLQEYHINVIPIEHEGKRPTQKQLVQLIEKSKKIGIKNILIGEQFDQRNIAPITRILKGQVITYNPLQKEILKALSSISEKVMKAASKK